MYELFVRGFIRSEEVKPYLEGSESLASCLGAYCVGRWKSFDLPDVNALSDEAGRQLKSAGMSPKINA